MQAHTHKIDIPRFSALRIFAEASPRRRLAVLACLLAGSLAEGVGIAVLLPLLGAALGDDGARSASALSRFVVDALALAGLPVTIDVLVPIVFVAIVLKACLTLFAMSRVGYAVADVSTGLRRSLVGAVLEVTWGYYARQLVGRFGNAMSIEAQRAGDAWLSVATFIADLFQALVYLALALLVSWNVFFGAVAVGGILFVSLNRFVRKARRSGRQQTVRTKALVAGLTDALVGIKPLKAMGRHPEFEALFARAVRDLNRALRKQVFSRQIARSLQEPLIVLFLLAALYVALSFSGLRGAELLVMLGLMWKTSLTIGRAQQDYTTIGITESAFWSIRSAITEAQAAREIVRGTKVPSLEQACILENVSFSFGDKAVLRNVSMTISSGQITTITGHSGAGKTTVADLVLGLYWPDQGQVRIDDLPLAEVDLLRWRRRVGYVPQEVILFHDTVLTNLTLGEAELTREDAEAALKAAGAWEFVCQLKDGLDTVVGERGTLLSGGQRQRIAVARALVHKPLLLILDEATSALDPDSEAAICENVRSLSQRTGLTVLAISHQRSWVEAAHRVYHLQRHQARLVA